MASVKFETVFWNNYNEFFHEILEKDLPLDWKVLMKSILKLMKEEQQNWKKTIFVLTLIYY